MNVIHYILGMPPLRKGGLPKYALSLIESQKQLGYNIKVVVPGPFDKRNQTKIKKWKDFNGVPCYRIVNALPVSNGYGIKEIGAFVRELPEKVFEDWFDRNQVDIIHVHSIMGLPLEFLKVAGKRSIKIIMTTHDFFGLCPKIDLMKKSGNCDGCDWSHCAECCQNAYSVKHLQFLHSDIYWWYCNQAWLFDFIHSKSVTKIRGTFNKLRKVNSQSMESSGPSKNQIDYTELKEYYQKIFSCIDFFHFNSEQTADIFCRNLDGIKGTVVEITNDDIHDNRMKKNYGGVLRLGYVGGKVEAKGFYFMVEKLQQLYREGRENFVCHTFMLEGSEEYPFIRNHGPYKYGEQKNIFKLMDVLIVPSMWRETYGMVVLEAICNGVPVLVSEYVGAKTLLKKFPGVGRVFSKQEDDFLKILREVYDDRDKLVEMNQEILKLKFQFDMETHTKEIENIYTML